MKLNNEYINLKMVGIAIPFVLSVYLLLNGTPVAALISVLFLTTMLVTKLVFAFWSRTDIGESDEVKVLTLITKDVQKANDTILQRLDTLENFRRDMESTKKNWNTK